MSDNNKTRNISITLPESHIHFLDLQSGGRSAFVKNLIDCADGNAAEIMRLKETTADYLLGKLTADQAMQRIVPLATAL